MSSQSALIARGLVLLGLTLGLAGGPAGAATAEGGYATADLARLAELLGQRGWHTRADGGGNLLITRSGSGPQSPAIPAPRHRPSAPLVDPSLPAERLPSDGWIAQQDVPGTPDGPPANRREPRPAAAQGGARTRGGWPDGWMAPLASRLEAGGWTVMRNAAAGLSFHREVAAPRPPGSLDQGTLASQAAVAQPAPDRLTALGEGLRPQGWGVEPEAGGTLTLRPPAGLPAPPAAAAPERVAAPWEPQIREALTRRGWDLRRDAAGNLLLMPTGLGLFSA